MCTQSVYIFRVYVPLDVIISCKCILHAFGMIGLLYFNFIYQKKVRIELLICYFSFVAPATDSSETTVTSGEIA